MNELSCPFCDIENDNNQLIRFRNNTVLFSEAPRYQGALKYSGIIIPVAHRETVFELSSKELSSTFTLLKEVKRWMDSEYQPDGYNIGWNCGEVGGQEIFHAHLHVIPRFKQEPLAGRGIRAHLKTDENKW